MGIENGSGIPEFKSENFSRSFVLADKFKNSGVLGEKSDPNERDMADEKAREILNTSFEVKNAEGQMRNVEYSSVEHMIEISKGDGWTDDTKERAKQALYEVGLALSQDKAIFKAATEGEEELNKLLPPNLHEIQPYILSSYLTEGESDKDGKELLGEMMDLFKLKRRADKNPEYYRDDFEAKAKSLFTKLSDKCDDASAEDVAKGRVGRWEAMAGFVKGVDDRTGRRPVLTDYDPSGIDEENDEELVGHGTQSVDYVPPTLNRDTGEWDGGSRWELSPEFAAEAMKFMDHTMRWTSYTPPEWFKNLPETLQAKIEYMVAVNGAAANLVYAKKDLDKVMSNDSVFSFTHAQLEILFDDDFKLVVSKMLNDLCEVGDKTTDQNGIQCLRYKEKSYYYDFNAKKGDGAYTDKDGRVLGPGEPRVLVETETPDNLGKFIREIDESVFSKIRDIKKYEDKLALFLAEAKQKEVNKEAILNGLAVEADGGVWRIYKDDVFQNGKLVHKKGEYVTDWHGDKIIVNAGLGVWETYSKNIYENRKLIHRKGDYLLDKDGNKRPGYLPKMNAYTAYNFFYAMGDSSLADRKRILPTWNGVVSDAIRTLNPEYKARGKWQVEKSGRIRHLSNKDFLLESEYFGGPTGRYILTVAKLERDLGQDIIDGEGNVVGHKSKPIDGDKTIMEKVYDGTLNPFPDKTYYGFFDFFNTSRDLEFSDKKLQENNKGFSFAELMMKYGHYEGDDFVKDESQQEFHFKSNSSTTFENEFFDSIDAAVFTGRCIMGKEKVEDLGEFGTKIMGTFGMVNGITIGNGENKIRPFSYTRSPEVIRSMLVGVFGADFGRLSSEYIPIVKKLGKNEVEINYDLFVYDVLTSNKMGMGLNANEINLNKVMRLLGVGIEPGKMPNSNIFRAINAGRREKLDRDRTFNLLQKQKSLSYKGEATTGMKDLISVFNGIKGKSVDEDYRRMVSSFERAIDFGDLSYAKRLLETMKRF